MIKASTKFIQAFLRQGKGFFYACGKETGGVSADHALGGIVAESQ